MPPQPKFQVIREEGKIRIIQADKKPKRRLIKPNLQRKKPNYKKPISPQKHPLLKPSTQDPPANETKDLSEAKPQPPKGKPRPHEAKPRPPEAKPQPHKAKPRPPEAKPRPPEAKPQQPKHQQPATSQQPTTFQQPAFKKIPVLPKTRQQSKGEQPISVLPKKHQNWKPSPKNISVLPKQPLSLNLPLQPIPWVSNVYCINLESCKQRKNQMKKQFNLHQFRVHFIKAIHPGHPEHKKRFKNQRYMDTGWVLPRCYCLHQCAHKTRKLRSTEIAIALSHYATYQKMIKNDDKWALVVEDDVVFCQNFTEIINQKIPVSIHSPPIKTRSPNSSQQQNTIPPTEEPIIIFLGGGNDNFGLKINQPESFTLAKAPSGCYSNYCYLINLAGAKYLVRKFFPITRPEDSYKRFWIHKGRIKSYRVFPSMVAELSAGTNTEAVYNRWSLTKSPPRPSSSTSKTTIIIDQATKKNKTLEEFQQSWLESQRKKPNNKRTISYNKNRIINKTNKPNKNLKKN